LQAVPDRDGPSREGRDWLHAADDDLLACRATGHAFPKIRARSGKLPRGISARRQHDGAFQIAQTCRDCGTRRWLTTLPGGELDLPARYSYEYPIGYASPKGSHVNRRLALAEVWRRALETVAVVAE
jgi:hypothetical protein